MLHSCTPASNKENILQSFQKEQGYIRILVATIAFGMGVDCKEVYRTIHFGPAKNVECYMQQSGRAGRDLLYQGMPLMHVDKEVKEYVKHKDCRRKFLLQHFEIEQLHQPNPTQKHLCCDNFSAICKCGLDDCKVLNYPTYFESSGNEASRERHVTNEQRESLRTELSIYHKSLITSLLKRDASGKLKSFTHSKSLLGFSDIQISQVLDHCSEMFSIRDICNLVEIWDLQHAIKIYGILDVIFMDMDDSLIDIEDDDLSSDEEDILPEDWRDLAPDDELADMAIENLSLSQMDDSNNASMDNAPTEVLFAALNAVIGLLWDLKSPYFWAT